jgi:lysophospholipid acyltransferase (LPLAT)-like uncharacterized protein
MQSTSDTPNMQNKIPLDFVSGPLWLMGSLLGRTWRYTVQGTREIDPFRCRGKGVIFCFWHSHILPLAYIFRGVGITAVVSASKDGDRATAVAQRWNHQTIRGSSTRGQVGVLRQCIRALESGNSVIIVPDGPHGPREQVKPGAAMIAMMTHAPVFPVIAAPRHAWRLNSWDRFMIPKPFTHVTVTIKDSLNPSHFGHGEGRLERFTAQLQQALAV